jgi:hypothetical protein
MLRNARTSAISRAGLRIPVFVFAVLATAFVFAAPFTVHAQIQTAPLEQTANAAGVGGTSDLVTIIGRLINIFLGTLGVIFLILMLYAGFIWMTSAGDPEKIKKATGYIRNAIIGLVIIASAWAITAFVLGFFAGQLSGGGGTSNQAGGSIGFSSGAGALGSGIESHYPPRNALNIPRNTKIIITFKRPVKLSSMIAGYDDKGTPADLTDDTVTEGLNDAAVKIFPTGSGVASALTSAQARVKFTADRKTFVFSKVGCSAPAWDCFGSATKNTGYTVELMGGKTGALLEDNNPVFTGLSGCSNGGAYCWNFEVSTELDLTPPHIVSVYPYEGDMPDRNVIIQMQFSEAIDPTSATGFVTNSQGFQNIQTHANGVDTPLLDGEYRISNQYRTVEFVPAEFCGKNTCGGDVFCLPGGVSIDELVKAASLDGEGPGAQFVSGIGYNGVVDAAGNSFDGNNDGHADGPDGNVSDNYGWRFNTTVNTNLDAPYIETTQPPSYDDPGKSNIDPYAPVSVRFNSVLQSSSFNTDNARFGPNEAGVQSSEPAELRDTFWWQTGTQMVTKDNAPIASLADKPFKTIGTVDHRTFASSTLYYPYIKSGIQNVYQNCFNPASSNDADSNRKCEGSPNCCDDLSNSEKCKF